MVDLLPTPDQQAHDEQVGKLLSVLQGQDLFAEVLVDAPEGATILNVYSDDVHTDASYLYTLTLSRTP